jgi:probable F420-dependent oxidoreductase
VDLPLDPRLRIGFIAGFDGREAGRSLAGTALRLGYESIWVGDHVAFPLPILDPFLQLAQLAAHGDQLELGTSVYLLPLRHPVLVAKQVASLDRLCDGRFVFGVGIGGEFPAEYQACGVPREERGARLSESIPLVRALVRGEATGGGRFYPFPETRLRPAATRAEGPPIWCGGRAPAALARIGRMGDGWISYVVTPERYRQGLEQIAKAAEAEGRRVEHFGTSHLLFARIDDDPEAALEAANAHLSKRYAMDFREPTRRYAAYGRPADVAERIEAFRSAGVRHLILDMVGPAEDRDDQLERFSREVRPLLSD